VTHNPLSGKMPFENSANRGDKVVSGCLKSKDGMYMLQSKHHRTIGLTGSEDFAITASLSSISLLHKGFAFERGAMARNDRLEVKFRHFFQSGDLFDRKTASQVGHRRIHQIAGNQNLFFRQIRNRIASSVAAAQVLQLELRGFPALCRVRDRR
jgi:hypothetical protein